MYWIFRLLFIIPVLLLQSCANRTSQNEQYTFHDDGMTKPKVAMIPVLDHSHSDLPWNLSEELTEAIDTRMFQSGKFFLTNDFEILGKACQANPEVNPFLDDLDWIKELNSSTEFVVFIELLEHSLIPKPSSEGFFNLQMTKAYTLDMAMRCRVIDIREAKPKVILQEIARESFHIPWRITSIDLGKSSWSRAAFSLSPLGMAHSQMVKKVTKQVQDYILLSKYK